MAIILNIDTATETASVCMADGENILAVKFNSDAKQHASFLQPAVAEICKEAKPELKQIDAVAVSNGPGSYTGLRVGLSSAKGICYALKKPLILINTLQVIAEANKFSSEKFDLIAPMIDARRMEVFTAVFDTSLQTVMEPAAMILTAESFENLLQKQRILFCGGGAEKWRSVSQHPNAIFQFIQHNAGHLNVLAQKAFNQRQFADLAYAEPFYVKAFFDTHKL